MKKLTALFTVLILFCSISARAQHRIGVVGGLNIAEFDVENPGPATEISSKTVFGVGGVIDLRLTPNFSLYLQPLYQQKGALVKDTDSDLDLPFKMEFLELPVFLKAEFGNTIRPYVMAGPTVGYLLSSEVKGEQSGVTFTGDLKDVTESIDFGLGFGAGISYPLKKMSVFVEGRYTLGLTNMQKGGTFELTAGPVSEQVTWDKEVDAYKNRGIQIMAGVTFPLGD